MTTLLPIADVRWQLSVTATDEDDQIGMLLAAAVDHVERYTGQILSPRTVTETFDRFGPLRLRAWPIAPDATVTITYLDSAGASQTQAFYRLAIGDRPARLLPGIGLAWPTSYCSPGAVKATFQAGYADATAIPASIKQAILLLTRHFYDNRSAVEVGSSNQAVELPLGVKSLLASHRMMTV